MIEFSFARSLGRDVDLMNELDATAKRLNGARPTNVRGTYDWTAVDSNRATMSWIRSADPKNDFARKYDNGDYVAALASWRANPWQPTNSYDNAMLGHVLAEAGDDAALAYIDPLRPWQPIEAEALTGLLLYRKGNFAGAATLFSNALTRYREDPWPLPRLMNVAIDDDRRVRARSEGGRACGRRARAALQRVSARRAARPRVSRRVLGSEALRSVDPHRATRVRAERALARVRAADARGVLRGREPVGLERARAEGSAHVFRGRIAAHRAVNLGVRWRGGRAGGSHRSGRRRAALRTYQSGGSHRPPPLATALLDELIRNAPVRHKSRLEGGRSIA